MRGEAKIEELKSGREQIIITSIPYQVIKSKLVEKIADLVKEKKIEGISDLRDESNKEGIRIVVEVKREGNAEIILSQIYTYTELQSNFSANILALNDGKPENLGVLDIIKIFTNFRKNIVTRRTEFLLEKARDRAHILIGLRVAVNEIDEIIKLIRKAKDTSEAKIELMRRDWGAEIVKTLIELIQDKGNKIENQRFYFTDAQARAILDMKLSKLTGLESTKIDEELGELSKEIQNYLEILSNDTRLMKIVVDELMQVKNEYLVPRRTQILDAENDIDVENLIPKEDMVVITTMNGYIKRIPLSSYKAQNRGGKGKSAITVHDEDFTTDVFVVNTHTPILFFSSKGKVYRMKTYKLPLGNNQSKGRAVVNILPLEQDEVISTVLPLLGEKEEWMKKNIVFATNKGDIRRNSMDDFENIQSNGKIAMKLQEGEKLVGVAICDDSNDILLSSKLGKCVRFPIKSLRIFQSRNSTGVRGIKLNEFNEVISLSVLKNSEAESVEDRDNYLKIDLETRMKLNEINNAGNTLLTGLDLNSIKIDAEILKVLSREKIDAISKNEEFILSITENGFGKRTSAYEYRVTNRGGSGVTNIATTERNGHVIASFPIENDKEIIMISDKGTVIRTKVKNIRIIGRTTQGVRLMKIANGEKVVSIAKIESTDENELEEREKDNEERV
jgi:DNA gyrase subunit A